MSNSWFRLQWCTNFQKSIFVHNIKVYKIPIVKQSNLHTVFVHFIVIILTALSWIDEKRINFKELHFQKNHLIDIFECHLKSYVIIKDHGISLILIRYHGLNMSEYSVNDIKLTTTNKIHNFSFFESFYQFYVFLLRNFQKEN